VGVCSLQRHSSCFFEVNMRLVWTFSGRFAACWRYRKISNGGGDDLHMFIQIIGRYATIFPNTSKCFADHKQANQTLKRTREKVEKQRNKGAAVRTQLSLRAFVLSCGLVDSQTV
jgi:hypothetical protein